MYGNNIDSDIFDEKLIHTFYVYIYVYKRTYVKVLMKTNGVFT